MTDLKTHYAGIVLKNPLVVGASNLVTEISILKRLENAGASAIVYKSLFEEQIQLENLQMHETMQEFAERNAEMISLFPNLEHAGPQEFILNLRKAREAVSIPLIASLNAVYEDSWVEYAKLLEETGVNALELNFYAIPKNFSTTESEIIDNQLNILKKVVESVSVPVTIKLSPFYTNVLGFVQKADQLGMKGVVIFNRLFQPDIDIEKETHFFPYNLSHEEDNRLALRFSGLLYGNISANICANTGIHTGKDVIKLLLAGADCVQVVSSLYKNQPEYLTTMLEDIEQWMNSKQYHSINDFKGKLSKKSMKDPFAYKRAQYVDILLKSNEIFKKYPTT